MKDLIKDVHENGVKSDYKEPKLYDVVPKEEIAEFEEVMREIIADIVSEASDVACWVLIELNTVSANLCLQVWERLFLFPPFL